MRLLTSRAPRPALTGHPEFALMLAATLERFRCTLGEVREDYWLGRVWRALGTDQALEGRVARLGVATVLVTGPGYGAAPASAKERERWRLHIQTRVEADTGRPLDLSAYALDLAPVCVPVAELVEGAVAA